ncbi:MAG: Glu/Leu/Phe/Val family dehydrogenase, partial [Ilumatobacteraceae bacterium]
VTGKPIELGGSLGRESATGRGVVEAAELAGREIGLDLRGARISIQGYGQVGAWAARLASARGARIVAVADVGGAIHRESGIDVAALDAAMRAGARSVVETDQGDIVAKGADGSPALFALPADIVMPCALGDAVDARVAATMDARLVVEGANGPLTPDADEVLADKGVVVVPDVYANAGGVTCSYLEQCQNFAHLSWDEDEVNRTVVDLMRGAFRRLHGFATEHAIPYRMAAQVLGMKTIADAHRLRGLHP